MTYWVHISCSIRGSCFWWKPRNKRPTLTHAIQYIECVHGLRSLQLEWCVTQHFALQGTPVSQASCRSTAGAFLLLTTPPTPPSLIRHTCKSFANLHRHINSGSWFRARLCSVLCETLERCFPACLPVIDPACSWPACKPDAWITCMLFGSCFGLLHPVCSSSTLRAVDCSAVYNSW